MDPEYLPVRRTEFHERRGCPVRSFNPGTRGLASSPRSAIPRRSEKMSLDSVLAFWNYLAPSLLGKALLDRRKAPCDDQAGVSPDRESAAPTAPNASQSCGNLTRQVLEGR